MTARCSMNLDFDEFDVLRGLWTPRFPPRFDRLTGSVPKDLVLGGSPALWLISARFQEVLRQGNVTGWDLYDVELFDGGGSICPGYAGLRIFGRSGPLDWSQSQATVLPPAPA